MFAVTKDDQSRIEVRSFYSPDEIRGLDNFVEDNPVDNHNFVDILGDYNYEPKERCCRLKNNGNLCYTKHNFGFVVLLDDGTATLVGNCCAEKSFGVDSKIKAKRSSYMKEKERLRLLKSVRDLLAREDSRLRQLEKIEVDISNVNVRKLVLRQNIGDKNIEALNSRARSEKPVVTLKLGSHREYEENGEIKKEVTWISYTMGILHGLSVFDRSLFTSIDSNINSLKYVYKNMNTIADDAPKPVIDKLLRQLNLFDDIERQHKKIVNSWKRFSENEPLLLCFLVDNKNDRYRAARWAMHKETGSGSKSAAKIWLAKKHSTILRENNADTLYLE